MFNNQVGMTKKWALSILVFLHHPLLFTFMLLCASGFVIWHSVFYVLLKKKIHEFSLRLDDDHRLNLLLSDIRRDLMKGTYVFEGDDVYCEKSEHM